MKIQIEISEETAACLWADHNPCPKHYPIRPIEQVLQDLAEERAAKYKDLHAGALAYALKCFRKDRGEP